MAGRIKARAARLGTDQPRSLIGDERMEHADRVRAAADARDHAIGKSPRGLEHLSRGHLPDYSLEAAHERRNGAGPTQEPMT